MCLPVVQYVWPLRVRTCVISAHLVICAWRSSSACKAVKPRPPFEDKSLPCVWSLGHGSFWSRGVPLGTTSDVCPSPLSPCRDGLLDVVASNYASGKVVVHLREPNAAEFNHIILEAGLVFPMFVAAGGT